MFIPKLMLSTLILILVTGITTAQNINNTFVPPNATRLGQLSIGDSIYASTPVSTRLYIQLDIDPNQMISVKFSTEETVSAWPELYFLDSDAEVYNGLAYSVETGALTRLFGVQGQAPYFLVFDLPQSYTVTILEGDTVRKKSTIIKPNEFVEGEYDTLGQTTYYPIDGVQDDEIITLEMESINNSAQIIDSRGHLINRLSGLCTMKNKSILSFRLTGKAPYTINMAAFSQEYLGTSYRLTLTTGLFRPESVKDIAIGKSISLPADADGVCNRVRFVPPHPGTYLFLTLGKIDLGTYGQIVNDINQNSIQPLDYKVADSYRAVRYYFETTDPVEFLIGNKQSLLLSVTDGETATESLYFNVGTLNAGDDPAKLAQTNLLKSNIYQINGEKGDLLVVKTINAKNKRIFCRPLVYGNQYTFLNFYDRNVEPIDEQQYEYWFAYILTSDAPYSLHSYTNECTHIFQLFKAGTKVSFDDLNASFDTVVTNQN